MGVKTLNEILFDKSGETNEVLMQAICEATGSLYNITYLYIILYNLYRLYISFILDEWGILVESIEIQNISLPHDIQRAMATEAEESKRAKAKVKPK